MASGGFKLSLGGAKGKLGLKKPTEQPAKRRRLALDDDEPVDTNTPQEITGWDLAGGGAVDANKIEEPKGPRIIPTLSNQDWGEAARKRQLVRTGAPPQPAESSNGAGTEQSERPEMAFGLTTFDKKDEPERMDIDEEVEPEDNRTEEEKLQAEAFDALVNGKPKDQTVIPISEEEAFDGDVREAPDEPGSTVFEDTPIDGFGAALLRGMGWAGDDESAKGKKPAKKPKELDKRPTFLGIGANPAAAEGVEIGEWGGPKKGGKKGEQYLPVAMRSNRTGETLTENELKERVAKQKEDDAKAARNNTFVGDDNEEGDRRREKRKERKDRDRRDDDYDSERRKDRSSRRDRDEYSDRDRDRRREKKYSDYEDSERDRRRDKKYRDDDYDRKRDKYRDDDYDDRKREKRRDRESGRDRSRSPHDDDRREKRRDRDRRDRSVDDKDRREKRRDRSRDRDDEDRRRKRREYEYEDDKDEKRSKYKDDKYSRR